MAVTNFKYASINDLKNYFNHYADFDQKVQIFPTLTSGNLHLFRDSGKVDVLFVNGEELASAQSTSGAVDSNGEWYYNALTNQVEYYNSNYSSTTINEQVFESGIDFSTFMDQQLVNASLELNNLLDARFSTPLPKNTQVDYDTGQASSTTVEYDPIIVKATCYITASNIIRSRDPQDTDAQAYYDMVTNADGTGIIDRLNKGKIKLSFEIDNLDSKGNIKEVNKDGTMNPVQLYGDFVGGRGGYECLRITCTTGGVYGVAKCSVDYYGSNKLFGKTTTNNIVTGGIDYWNGMGGLGIRFQGNSMAVDDVWEIEVMSDHLEPTNTATKSIQLHRNATRFYVNLDNEDNGCNL